MEGEDRTRSRCFGRFIKCRPGRAFRRYGDLGCGYSTLDFGGHFYCNEVTPAYTECPTYINYNVAGIGTHNQSYAKGATGQVYVCERVTIRYHAANVSHRCGWSPADSQCDLYQYGVGITLSMYTDNDYSVPSDMVGKEYTGTVCA